jgi:uncharacterized membrane protein YccC
MWLARGRTAQPEPISEIPGGTAPVKLTRPLILFAVIRAIAIAVAVAIAFGLHLPNADWMPIAALVAMKPSLQQSTLVAVQRLAGAIIGAAVAALFLLTVDSKTGLEVVMVVLGALAGSIRLVNYAFYCAAVAGTALIAMDLPHPSNLTTRDSGCCTPSSAWGSVSSSSSWRTCCKSAPPPRRHHRHLFTQARAA